jgi:tetratricopeptide (TPR) repeat protein
LSATRAAYALDPLSSAANGVLAKVWLMAGHPDSSIVRAVAGLALDPDVVLMREQLALALSFSGQLTRSAAEFEKTYQSGPDRYDGRANLIYARVAAGRMAEARKERAALEHDAPGNSPWYRRAIADAALGALDQAITELERGVAAREPLIGLISLPCDPRFVRLRDNPRFGALVTRLGATACPVTLPWPFPSLRP